MSTMQDPRPSKMYVETDGMKVTLFFREGTKYQARLYLQKRRIQKSTRRANPDAAIEFAQCLVKDIRRRPDHYAVGPAKSQIAPPPAKSDPHPTLPV